MDLVIIIAFSTFEGTVLSSLTYIILSGLVVLKYYSWIA